MKKGLAVLLFFISIPIFSQIEVEANYLVKYEVNFAIDSTEREERTIEIHDLYAGSNSSYYVSEVLVKLDTMMAKFKNMSMQQMRRTRGSFNDIPRPEFIARVFKDAKEDKALVQVQLLREKYVYEEKNFPVEWEIHDETKQIEDYVAQKATTRYGGRNYEAWFTFQVPIQDGPFVFNGLPGLILEVSDLDEDYKFSVISVQKLDETRSFNSESDEYQEVKKDKFIKAYGNLRKDPLGSFAETIRKMESVPDPMTGEMISGAELIRKMRKEADRRNNYIERWKE